MIVLVKKSAKSLVMYRDTPCMPKIMGTRSILDSIYYIAKETSCSHDFGIVHPYITTLLHL